MEAGRTDPRLACGSVGPVSRNESIRHTTRAAGKSAGTHGPRAQSAPAAPTPDLAVGSSGESVLFDEGLSVTARCVYAVLSRYVYQGATVKIGQRRIAKLLGVHVETVNVAIHELEDRRHIAIQGEGKARLLYHLSSFVFGQKQRAGVEEVISSPSRMRRFASVRRA